MDPREVITARRKLPPVSGGTLLAVSGGELVVAADPDRDRIYVVNLRMRTVDATIALDAGAEPGRLAEDAAKRVHVLLRGTGEVATIDTVKKTLLERRAACAEPRGIAYDRAADSLIVACAEGELVELAASGGAVTRTTTLDIDVRDVLFTGEQLRVTRFKSAEVLELSPQRAVMQRRTLPSVVERLRRDLEPHAFKPNVAWRAAPGPNGSTVVVHQRALADVLDLELLEQLDETTAPILKSVQGENVDSHSAAIALQRPVDPRRGPYGGGTDGCGGIVHSAVSIVNADGTVVSSAQLAGVVLPVDIAVSPTGTVFIANAGVIDPNVGLGGVAVSFGAYSLDDLRNVPSTPAAGSSPAVPQECVSPKLGVFEAPAIAVAYEPVSGTALVQTREPPELLLFDAFSTGIPSRIQLSTESVADTGHELFNRDAGGGVACASCHPEGTEDGHTWRFSDVGPRRTQPLDVGLRGTAPFHWDGSLPDMHALMGEVFTRRMGGFRQSPARALALEDFIANLRPRAPHRSPLDDAALRGKALFESAEVGCATCHSGERFSDNLTVHIGKGDTPTQTPSLLGVAYRAPFMHDGCASTLIDRFDPTCGGTKHGNVAQLDAAEVGDLIAYLESL